MEIFERPQVLTQQPLRVLRQSPPQKIASLEVGDGEWGFGILNGMARIAFRKII